MVLGLGEYEGFELSHPADQVLQVTINRPDKMNAFTAPMFGEISRLCADIKDHADIRAVVLTGAGKGFCAGLDLTAVEAIMDMTPYEYMAGQEEWSGAAISMRRLPIPIIAAVNGAAAGAGLSLALAADIRIASTKAKFNAAFIKVGLTGGDVASSWLLPRIVGFGIANEILMTGRFVDPEEALRIGLVNKVVEPEDLIASALETAAMIAGNSPLGIRMTKQVLQSNVDAPSIEAAVDLENRSQALTAMGKDMREAMFSFLEKRTPTFTRE